MITLNSAFSHFSLFLIYYYFFSLLFSRCNVFFFFSSPHIFISPFFVTLHYLLPLTSYLHFFLPYSHFAMLSSPSHLLSSFLPPLFLRCNVIFLSPHIIISPSLLLTMQCYLLSLTSYIFFSLPSQVALLSSLSLPPHIFISLPLHPSSLPSRHLSLSSFINLLCLCLVHRVFLPSLSLPFLFLFLLSSSVPLSPLPASLAPLNVVPPLSPKLNPSLRVLFSLSFP